MQRATYSMSATGGFSPNAIPEGFAYATIGPNSLVDVVTIGGVRLGLDAPIRVTAGADIKRVRPLRVTGGQINTELELELWTECETPVACKRNPAEAKIAMTPAGGAVPYELILRLPFAGRRAGVVHVNGDTGKAYDWALWGVKYLDTLAVGAAARDKYTLLDSGTETPTALLGIALDGLTLQIGGLDRHVDYDEIEFWAKGDAAAAEMDVRGEGYDLCR